MQTLYVDETVAIGEVDNVLLVAWLAAASVAMVERLEKASLELARRNPTGIAHLNVVPKTASSPGLADDARARILQLLRNPAHRLVASATVYGDSGFLSATIRGALIGLSMLSGSKAKMTFVPTVTEAERQLRKALDLAQANVPPAGRLVEAVASFQVAAAQGGRYSF